MVNQLRGSWFLEIERNRRDSLYGRLSLLEISLQNASSKLLVHGIF